MVVTTSFLVDVASVTLFALAPYAVYQKYQLAELGGMRGQMNDLRQVRVPYPFSVSFFGFWCHTYSGMVRKLF